MNPISITRYQHATENGPDRVFAFVRSELLSGRLKTGDRLLSERDLASALGVSRPVIREALRSLAAIGAVEIQRGYGTVVREPDFHALSEYFSFVLAQQADVVDDIVEVRIAIERQAIRLACQRARSGDLNKMAAAFQTIVETVKDPARGGAADFNFHLSIVEAAHSPTLLSVYVAIGKLLEQSHMERRRKIENIPGINRYLIDHHGAILSAIQERNAGKAEKLLIEHFEIGASLRNGAAIGILRHPNAALRREGSPPADE